MTLAAAAAHFTWIDWSVLAAYLVFTTALGAKLAGKQATIRDFFLGGRKLPWPAVAGSIIATEISAVTFISAPAIVFAAGGDLTYLQLAIGAILARVIIGVWFVPAFYKREIYSPYDYIGDRLGSPARSATTGLFMLGAVLGQSVRVLLTALVLKEITGLPLAASIWIIGAVAVGWTLLGGITTVIWTDVIQFAVFTFGLIAALVFVLIKLPGGWSEIFTVAAAATDALGEPASKLRFWNFSTDPNTAFTIYAAVLANTVFCLNAYGTDQLIAQRMFCCRGPREARKAIIFSSVAQLMAVLAMFVGLALYAYYQQFPLTPEQAARVAEKSDRIFPIFIIEQIPVGLTGLIIAGVFAAAISSLDSVLAALSQSVVTGFYKPWRAKRHEGVSDRRDVFVSKILVVFWAIVLCAVAQVAELGRAYYGDILILALALASFTGGAILAAFLLAFFRLNVDHRGVVWGGPLSVLTVFAISFHQTWAQVTTAVLAILMLTLWTAQRIRSRVAVVSQPFKDAIQTTAVAGSAALAVFLSCFIRLESDRNLAVAWPWNVPIGFMVAFALGWILARRRAR